MEDCLDWEETAEGGAGTVFFIECALNVDGEGGVELAVVALTHIG